MLVFIEDVEPQRRFTVSFQTSTTATEDGEHREFEADIPARVRVKARPLCES